MKQKLFETVSYVCAALNKYNVEYLLIGGTAVAIYGHFRLTMGPGGKHNDKLDIDLWFNPTLSNYYRLLDALAAMNYDVSVLKNEIADPKQSYLKLNFDHFKLDLLPIIPGFENFDEAYKTKEVTEVKGVEVIVISLSNLVKNKKATNRQKDMDDLEYL